MAVLNVPKLEPAVDGAEDGEPVTPAGAVPKGVFVGEGREFSSSCALPVGNTVESKGWRDSRVGAEVGEPLTPSTPLLVVDGAVVGAAVGANESCAPFIQISLLGLALDSIHGTVLGVSVVLRTPRPLSVLLDPEGAEEGADDTTPSKIPPVGLPLGCTDGVAVERAVGPAVTSFLLVLEVGEN